MDQISPSDTFSGDFSEELELLVAGYVLNSLSPEEVDRLATLATPTQLKTLVREMEQSLGLAYDPPLVEPSPRLRSAVLAAAADLDAIATDPIAAPPIPSAAPVQALPTWARAVGAIAAVLIAALATGNWILWRSLQMQRAQTAPGDRPLVVTLQPTAALTAPATVVFNANPDTLEATLTVSQLPPLDRGKVYVLWTVVAPNAPVTTDDKGAILTQVLEGPAAQGRSQRRTFRLPPVFENLDLVEAIAITIEDADAPQRHDAAPILIQQL
ncbi:MAG: hypothetical protein Fur0042_16790 [Cyanophyceae cyanobacterium]